MNTDKIYPLQAYLEFCSDMVVEECGLGYDAAVYIAKSMHRRGIQLPDKYPPVNPRGHDDEQVQRR